MEITINGKRHEIECRNSGFKLSAEIGRHYCDPSHCQYCEESTADYDAHEFRPDWPLDNFLDDQGNQWIYYGAVSHDDSASFGWWNEKHVWHCREMLKTADPLDIGKIRRRVEDALRKGDEKTILHIAALLHVRME